MIVLKGLTGPVTVKGQQYGTAVMQPWDKTLTDQKIADVLSYERSEWGNSASPVTAEQIAALRKELANHPNSFTEPDILAVPAEEDLPGGAPAGAAPLNRAKLQSLVNHQNRKGNTACPPLCRHPACLISWARLESA